ncbi:alcohol dehydrogenase catalytic domain-containing protein [Kribbella sp. NPDC050820]|uniref:zinc-dependent alcohol dehydrogenase n=1 Tax=Kribbella sp. NPDC050820 TaxID=3155408 RepID=UPI00340DCF04
MASRPEVVSAGRSPTRDMREAQLAEMTAARWHGQRDIRLEQIPVPALAPDEALVGVRFTGVCGSDLEEYEHGPVVIRGPITLGHEIVGRVVRPAGDGSGPSTGTDVVVDVVTGCGDCYWCKRHEEGLCPDLDITGQHVDGGLAQYVAARARRLIPVPPTLDIRHAAMAEPTAVAVRAVGQAGGVLGRSVVVVGGGTVGLLVAQVLRHAGATPVVILEPAGWRRDVATALGLRAEWADDEVSRRALIAALLPERGADAVIECAGAPGTAAESVRIARSGGTVVILGVVSQESAIDLTGLVLGEKLVKGSTAHMWDDDVITAVSLLESGAVKVGALITHVRRLDEAPEAFELLASREQRVLKVLIDCAAG